MTMKKLFQRVDFVIGKIEDILSVTLFGVIIIIVTAHIFSRYVLRSGILWSDEVIQILLVAMVIFGAARAIRTNGHTDMQGLVDSMPKPVGVFLRVFSNTATLFFLLVFFLSSFKHTMDAGQVYTVILRIPRRVSYASMPIGALLMVYEFAKLLKSRILNTR
jgi:TRAP-type C4-dicarboxylate transport system permease small subunit